MHGCYTSENFLEEIKQRFDIVDGIKENDPNNQSNPEYNSYYSETEMDEEMIKKENQEFQEARQGYVSKIEDISNMLKHQRNMQKIKKECMKNMIASPTLLEYPGPNAGHPS